MNKSEIFWQTYLGLEKELLEVARYIFITDTINVNRDGEMTSSPCSTQLQVFSPHIADLLIRTCIEIEAISKELYFDFGGEKARGDKNLFFDEDCLKLIDMKCKTHKKIVAISCPFFNLTSDDNKFFRPLNKAHERQGTKWERAYQAVKHNRYSSLSQGNIRNLIHAMGALYLLNIYCRDVRLSTKYLEFSNLDFSFGSSVFSVKRPNQQYVCDVINGKEVNDILDGGDSPFVLKYTDSVYKEVLSANETVIKEITKYWLAQPEIKEIEFQKWMEKAKERESKDPRQRVILLWELCEYRLHKKVPLTLPFEERKKLFVASDEWKGRIRQQNSHLEEDQITEENIQAEITQAGISAGMELQLRFENIKMVKAFNQGYCEVVLDKGDVKYCK